jgi:hypothetical protein
MIPDTPRKPDPAPAIDTGDRYEEIHFEPDPGQIVRVAHLRKPRGPLERQEQTIGADRPQRAGAPIEDVTEDASASSVWDGRPAREPEPEAGSGDGSA